jgi:hypothetical protein
MAPFNQTFGGRRRFNDNDSATDRNMPLDNEMGCLWEKRVYN